MELSNLKIRIAGINLRPHGHLTPTQPSWRRALQVVPLNAEAQTKQNNFPPDISSRCFSIWSTPPWNDEIQTSPRGTTSATRQKNWRGHTNTRNQTAFLQTRVTHKRQKFVRHLHHKREFRKTIMRDGASEICMHWWRRERIPSE